MSCGSVEFPFAFAAVDAAATVVAVSDDDSASIISRNAPDTELVRCRSSNDVLCLLDASLPQRGFKIQNNATDTISKSYRWKIQGDRGDREKTFMSVFCWLVSHYSSCPAAQFVMLMSGTFYFDLNKSFLTTTMVTLYIVNIKEYSRACSLYAYKDSTPEVEIN